ncbi:glycosyltransferase family 2 protein [Pseudidiomarina woesei]|jgi:cellulose synthase/poly-beta-1,6-N-acetylglucosamine synthase-like glycosyltransferase|uniref:Glycosyltransferase, catalytic subunit of cellulose synthase and poly-beta-1,6-N-acetylglucosamine synthase n=1 Tax=Pseudidiomarina woesei TaxID=1381080 RepID=A0A0K6HD62_9GAMM|nr:glycosyltransferase [Pseudidiomarina woesei]CUA88773.1 Glycosyltransferase, catalytic subunit of cellulose synthase and poly-beta-1,6-N-acetylglucosamine synthase [Pseudidiomarina woesei]
MDAFDKADWIAIAQVVFIGYFAILTFVYLLLNIMSYVVIRQYMKDYDNNLLPESYGPLLPPVSVIVPAYNESANIIASVKSILQLDYARYEVIVVNDGSKDDTLAKLKHEFALELYTEAYRQQVPSKPVIAVYRSRNYPQLRVIDKANGGKADALNAGINASRYPLFCAVDADSILQRDSLQRIVRPFIDRHDTVAVGGSIRVANGSAIRHGLLTRVGIPKSWLARFQIVEYLRAFLFGRMGWSPINGMLIISGAFGLFQKQAVVACGGYQAATVGEDMELVLRLHAHFKQRNKPYHIAFIPDPVCWTEAPEDMGTLRNQRIRWQRGLLESLFKNKRIITSRQGRVAGWVAYPFMLLFEGMGPLIEVLAYSLSLYFFMTDAVDIYFTLAFVVVAFGFGILMSTFSLILEELTFRTYTSKRALLVLIFTAVLENFGYRQINSWWRVRGLWQWLRGRKHNWGAMKRVGSINSP